MDHFTGLFEPAVINQELVSPAPPVVKITCQNEGVTGGNLIANVANEPLDLDLALFLEQAKVDTEQMNAIGQLSMQYPALGEAQGGDIDIVERRKRQFTQDGIAVVAVLIDRVLAIGIVIPDGVGKILKLIGFWPAIDCFPVTFVLTDNFLQKDHVAACFTEAIADAIQCESSVSGRKTFVNIEG